MVTETIEMDSNLKQGLESLVRFMSEYEISTLKLLSLHPVPATEGMKAGYTLRYQYRGLTIVEFFDLEGNMEIS